MLIIMKALHTYVHIESINVCEFVVVDKCCVGWLQ